jgi:hypothetical protein
MFTDAHDSYGLTVIGLGKHATAAALGPIRFLVESLAWLSWLLEEPNDNVRRARAYRLTMNGIEGYRSIAATLSRVAPTSAYSTEFASRLTASTDRMKNNLAAIIEQDGVTIPDNPGSLSRLAERYLANHGGYLMYALLNSAGAHPGPVHGFLFYGNPETGVADYDFKRMFDRRAYWIAQAIQLHLALYDLTRLNS